MWIKILAVFFVVFAFYCIGGFYAVQDVYEQIIEYSWNKKHKDAKHVS